MEILIKQHFPNLNCTEKKGGLQLIYHHINHDLLAVFEIFVALETTIINLLALFVENFVAFETTSNVCSKK